MDIKKRLYRYSDLKFEKAQLEEKIEDIKEQLTSIHSQSFDNVCSFSGGSDKTGNLIATLSDLQTLYITKCNELTKELIAIEQLISCLEPNERILIRKRYIECEKWEDVCVEMNYSWRGIHKLHSKILIKLEESA